MKKYFFEILLRQFYKEMGKVAGSATVFYGCERCSRNMKNQCLQFFENRLFMILETFFGSESTTRVGIRVTRCVRKCILELRTCSEHHQTSYMMIYYHITKNKKNEIS